MKIGVAPLLLASTLPFAGPNSTKPVVTGEDVSSCKLSSLMVEGGPSAEMCRQSANACIQGMRDAALVFSNSALDTLHNHGERVSSRTSGMLSKVDFFYQCRTNEFDLKGRLRDATSSDPVQREEIKREVASNDAEIGFVHERFVYPLVGEIQACLPETDTAQYGEKLIESSQQIKESHQVYNKAVTCLAERSERA